QLVAVVGGGALRRARGVVWCDRARGRGDGAARPCGDWRWLRVAGHPTGAPGIVGDVPDPMKVAAGSGDQQGVGSQSLAVEDVRPGLDLDPLYSEHAPFLPRVLIRLVGDGPHVDDLLQETFLVAHRKRASFDGRSAVRTWLYGIAAHLAMRHRRGAGRWRRALGVRAQQPPPRPAGAGGAPPGAPRGA